MLKGVDLMKTELFPINEKSELFSKAHSMHDCSFVATFEQNTLILTFDNFMLDMYLKILYNQRV